jgi:hypothetical protein
MANQQRGRLIGYRLNTDGTRRPSCEQADGRQYDHDAGGTGMPIGAPGHPRRPRVCSPFTGDTSGV